MDFASWYSTGCDGAAFGSKPAKYDADKRTVHSAAHDVAKNGAARADKGTRDDQKVIAEHESSGGGGPARVAVEHRDYDGHICTADGHDEMDAKDAGDYRGKKKRPLTGQRIRRH